MSMNVEYDRETFFPFSILEEVVSILKEKNCAFVTYADFNLNLIHPKFDDFSYLFEFINFQLGYPNTFNATAIWTKFLLKKIFTGQRLGAFLSKENNHEGPTVILQHDADQQPYKTIDMMNLEKSLNVVSSAYFFKNQNFDPEKSYSFDIEKLQDLENIGFEIGYHLNAYELADYDLKKAMDIVKSDLAYFKNIFNLRTFVPHGGHPSSSGLNNEKIPYKGILRKYSWCYNGRGFSHDEMWSDGNIYVDEIEDPRVVAARLTKGQRGAFLMHPQYYGNQLSPEYNKLPVSKEKWFKQLWHL